MRKTLAGAAAFLICLTSCETLRHQFAPLTANWEAKIGQLQYRGPKTTLIGEVLVRFSKQGDFELTFTKGPGISLLVIHQDANFARVRGPLARGTWSGPTDQAPARLRGWLALRALLTQAQGPTARYSSGPETFVFEF